MNSSPKIPASADESRYRLLVDAITDYAIFMLDAQGLVSSWNVGAERFKGYRPDEIIGQHFSRFYTPEDRETGLPARALATAEREGRFEHEGWRLRKDGARFWAHVIIDPIRTPQGELIGFAKITRDLTEKRAAEEGLRRSEEQFRLLVEGVTDYAIYLLDAEGRVSSWNSGARRIKGYEPSEIIGQHFSRFYTPEDQEAGWPGIALRAAAEQGRFEREGWRLRKDGSRFWAHVIIDAIHDDDGQVIGFAKITRDITERMESQRQLDEAREALFQAQKMEAVGQLTGGVAHDFNNLLMAVLGSLELVKKRLPYDPRITPLIENAVQGAQRGAVLTQRMLAFARKQELKVEPVDVAALARGMTDFVSRSIGPAVHVSTRFPSGLPLVSTDPYQLETGLLNLAVNARDAMPEGGTITITASKETVGEGDAVLAPGDYVRLSVADTGEGMDPLTVARASEPFFTTQGVGKGTGLGLSMVHGLAAQSGGRLEIQSRPGKGTTVSLWLPVAAGASEGLRLSADPRKAGARDGRLVILAVDDDDLVLMNTVAMLEDLGHEVLSASSGAQALEIIRERPWIDLVLTDQVMPRMTGAQLAAEVAGLKPDLPVAIATGYADMPPGQGLNALKLAKPFTQAELAGFVTSATRSRHEA